MIDGHGDDTYRYGGRIRMNFSSNIHGGTSHETLKARLAERLDAITAYPEPEAYGLEAMIARKHGIGTECVLVTSGATEAIYIVAQAFCRGINGGGLSRYAVRRPTFSEYDDACRMFGYAETAWPGDGGKGTVEGRTEADGGALLWLCNPNNPTGEALSPENVTGLRRNGDVLVVDQSYEDYTLAPMLSPRDVAGERGVILLHSMTKTYGVPGLRLGYVTAAPETIALLRGCMRPWSVNALAIEAGLFLVENGERAVADTADYLRVAEELRRGLDAVEGISVSPTATGFMLAEMSHGTAAGLKEYLAVRHGMLIRDCSNFGGLSARHFRVASRSAADNGALVGAVRMYMENLRRDD